MEGLSGEGVWQVRWVSRILQWCGELLEEPTDIRVAK